MDGFQVCRLTWFTFSFSGFCDPSCESPHSSFFPFLIVSHNMTESIGRCSTLLLVLWALSTSHLLGQFSEISAFWSVHDLFQDSWVAGFTHLGLLHDQHYPLTPHSFGCVVCRGDRLFESPVQHRQSWCQEGLCFCTIYFQSGSNPLICC